MNERIAASLALRVRALFASLGFQVVEEVEHERGVQVGERQAGGVLAGASFGEREEQLERVAVALDGVGAHASLLDQAPQEEVLQQGGERDRRRSHRAPPESCSPNA
jgi:hypothetical protein